MCREKRKAWGKCLLEDLSRYCGCHLKCRSSKIVFTTGLATLSKNSTTWKATFDCGRQTLNGVTRYGWKNNEVVLLRVWETEAVEYFTSRRWRVGKRARDLLPRRRFALIPEEQHNYRKNRPRPVIKSRSLSRMRIWSRSPSPHKRPLMSGPELWWMKRTHCYLMLCLCTFRTFRCVLGLYPPAHFWPLGKTQASSQVFPGMLRQQTSSACLGNENKEQILNNSPPELHSLRFAGSHGRDRRAFCPGDNQWKTGHVCNKLDFDPIIFLWSTAECMACLINASVGVIDNPNKLLFLHKLDGLCTLTTQWPAAIGIGNLPALEFCSRIKSIDCFEIQWIGKKMPRHWRQTRGWKF